ncbi:hypothetical protein [Paracraurococcus lichenis]|uniref:Uncharacterized protein n=1 Tax=Paracraurococcus lichenis TaxID=3064888 RepID=A0ABT9E0K2_9PROT|nr:hypothetical protein [Paracraurococcus sp. LOR1-02]MDO9709669.1 hypothetical protein [Paracraurococcus sp. LOR1-02]
MRPHPTSLAEAVRWAAEGGDALAVTIDEFLDAFYTETDPGRRAAMIREEPPRLGRERDDAYVGAVAEHLARRWGLPVPAWAAADDREVSEPWFVGSMGKSLAPLLLVESPIAFRRRRIFTEAEPLRRARMPLDASVNPFAPA